MVKVLEGLILMQGKPGFPLGILRLINKESLNGYKWKHKDNY